MPFHMFFIKPKSFNTKKMADNFLACVPMPEYYTLKMMCFLSKTQSQ